MKAHRMPDRKRAAQYYALHQQRLKNAAHHLALSILTDRYEKWQQYSIKDRDIIYTLRVLINEHERAQDAIPGYLEYTEHEQIAQEALREWKVKV